MLKEGKTNKLNPKNWRRWILWEVCGLLLPKTEEKTKENEKIGEPRELLECKIVRKFVGLKKIKIEQIFWDIFKIYFFRIKQLCLTIFFLFLDGFAR